MGPIRNLDGSQVTGHGSHPRSLAMPCIERSGSLDLDETVHVIDLPSAALRMRTRALSALRKEWH